MIKAKIKTMIEQSLVLKQTIIEDIKDVSSAEHEKLLERNDRKLVLMQEISTSHQELNVLLSEAMNKGIDVNIYRDEVNELEIHLRELYELNGKLASIVLPVRKMYKDIIDEITRNNGGTLLEIKA